MLDIKQLQNNFDEVAAKLSKRNLDRETLNALRSLALETKESKRRMEECREVSYFYKDRKSVV